MKKFFFNFFTSGVGKDLTPEMRRRYVALNSMLGTGVLVGWIFAGVAWERGNPVLALADLIIGSLVVALLVDFRLRRKYSFSAWAAVLLGTAFFLVLIVRGEEISYTLWLFVIPPLSIFLLGRWPGMILSLSSLVFVSAFLLVPGMTPITYPFHFTSRFAASFLVVSGFAFIFETIRLSTQSALEHANETLREAKHQSDLIFSGVSDGLFLLDRNGRIQPQHSASLAKIFDEPHPGGRQLLDLLLGKIPGKLYEGVKDFLELAFRSDIDDGLFQSLNPIEQVVITFSKTPGEAVKRHMCFHFERIHGGGKIAGLFTAVRDVTEEKELREKVSLQEEEEKGRISLLAEAMLLPASSLREILVDLELGNARISKVLETNEGVEDLFYKIFQIIHSLKGEALLLGFQVLGERIHRMEDALSVLKSDPSPDSESTHKVKEITRQLIRISDDLKSFVKTLADLQKTERIPGGREGALFNQLSDFVKREGVRSGKNVKLVMKVADIPAALQKCVRKILAQLTRNSVAHGIETPMVRVARGKNPEGTLQVVSERTEKEWRLRYSDDGAGLESFLLTRKAVQLGIADSESLKTWSPEEVINLIFHPGFTTAETADLTSGRGMGMTLVRDLVKDAGGRCQLKSEPGKSFELEMIFPIGK